MLSYVDSIEQPVLSPPEPPGHPPITTEPIPHNTETGKLLEGRTGEYAEATADAFLDDWLKTDADRARDAAAASATAAAAAAASAEPPAPTGTSSAHGPQHGGSEPIDAAAGGRGGARRRSSAIHHKSGTHATSKKRRSSQDHGHGNEHHHHGHPRHHHGAGGGGGGRHAHDNGKGRSFHDPARSERTSSSESDGGRSSHPRLGGHGGHSHDVSPQRRRNAAVGVISPASDISRTPQAESQESTAERSVRRVQADRNVLSLGVISSETSNLPSTTTAQKTVRSTEASEGSWSVSSAIPYTDSSVKLLDQAKDKAQEQESLGRANDDAAQLRATVERLTNELDSIKAGKAGAGIGVGGDGLWSNGPNSGFQFGAAAAAAAPMGGPPWVAGGMNEARAPCDNSLECVLVSLTGRLVC